MCSQHCVNTAGGYRCSCALGYSLDAKNNKSCIADGTPPPAPSQRTPVRTGSTPLLCGISGSDALLLVSTGRDVRWLNLRTSTYDAVQTGVAGAVLGVAGDVAERFVFWTESGRDHAAVARSLLDGTARETVVSLGVDDPQDVDFDWVGRHLYFADAVHRRIAVCDTHGSLCTVVVGKPVGPVRPV